MTTEELARKKIENAIAALKNRWMGLAMTLPLTDAGNAERLELVAQFQIADQIGQIIAIETMRT